MLELLSYLEIEKGALATRLSKVAEHLSHDIGLRVKVEPIVGLTSCVLGLLMWS